MMTTMTSRRNASQREPSPGLISVGANGQLTYRAGSYDPGDLKAIDTAIRHMPAVVAHCEKIGREILAEVGDGFEMVVSNQPSAARPRIYIVPRTNEAVRQTLSQSILLKCALGFQGR